MLTEVCDFVHNYFEKAVISGDFEIVEGILELDSFLKDGQRFRILGSSLNDGIYTYTSGGEIYDDDGVAKVFLNQEAFHGYIVSMAVPAAFISIVKDIKAWQEKNQSIVESPYQSESFGGYSYTRATGNGSGSGSGSAFGWRDVFRSRLNAYRKIA